MKEFVFKSIIVTLCASFLLAWFVPKYEAIDNHHKLNKVTGEIIASRSSERN